MGGGGGKQFKPLLKGCWRDGGVGGRFFFGGGGVGGCDKQSTQLLQ